MARFGLLGRHLSHTFSPKIHGMLGGYDYAVFEKEPEEVAEFLKSGEFEGLNVTVPYKKTVAELCNRLTDTAMRLGSVNTVVRLADGTLLGDNTDVYGFEVMLEKSGVSVENQKVLVLGSGGASAAVCDVLKRKGANGVVISRKGENHYGNLSRHKDAVLIVNATPVGMYPENGKSPIDLSLFPTLQGVFDLIYNPLRTQLLMEAEEQGLVTENGLLMLVAQAARSCEQFVKTTVDFSKIQTVYNALLRETENIVLIGMAGCGKTTVAARLGQMLGREVVDTDRVMEETSGKTIPEIFETEGEEAFRKMEIAVIKEVGKRSGIIISTGGGCVTRSENYAPLHQNGKIVWLLRDAKNLSREGRPLSQKTDPVVLLEQRRSQYAYFADRTVDNNSTVEKTVSEILEVLA